MTNIQPLFNKKEANGRSVNVKTCQVWIKDASYAKGRRPGRFYLRHYQHKALISKNGLYAFVVFDKEGKVLCSKLVDASTFPMRNYEKWGIPWVKIFNYQPESNKEGNDNAA